MTRTPLLHNFHKVSLYPGMDKGYWNDPCRIILAALQMTVQGAAQQLDVGEEREHGVGNVCILVGREYRVPVI
jgi:hypothetical protein